MYGGSGTRPTLGYRQVEIRSSQVECEDDLAALLSRLDRRIEPGEQAGPLDLAAEDDAVAGVQPLGRSDERRPRRRRQTAMKRRFDRCDIVAAMTCAREPGRNDAGIVEDQRVAWPQELVKLAESAIGEAVRGRGDQKTGAVARRGRSQRDPILRQVEIELRQVHRPRLGSRRTARQARRRAGNQRKGLYSRARWTCCAPQFSSLPAPPPCWLWQASAEAFSDRLRRSDSILRRSTWRADWRRWPWR